MLIKHQNCLRFGHNIRMMAKHVFMSRNVTLKCTATTTPSGSTQQYEPKCCKHVRFLKLGVRVTASWLLKKMFKVSVLIHHASIAGTRLSGQYFLPPRLTGSSLPRFIAEGPYRAVARCWSTDSDVPRGRGLGGGIQPPPRNSEAPPKSFQTQPDCENC